jgi:hypothetical protein
LGILLNELVELGRLLLKLLHEHREEIRISHELLSNLLPLWLLHHSRKRIASCATAHSASVLRPGLRNVSTHNKLKSQISVAIRGIESLNAHFTTSTGKGH